MNKYILDSKSFEDLKWHRSRAGACGSIADTFSRQRSASNAPGYFWPQHVVSCLHSSYVWSDFHGCSPTLFFECANCMRYPEIENKGLCNMKQPLFLLLHQTGYSTGLALISHPGVDRTCFQYFSHISDDLLKCPYYIYFRVTIVLRKVFGTCSCKHHSVNPTWRTPEIAVILLYQ